MYPPLDPASLVLGALILDAVSGLRDHRRHLLRMRLVHRMAGALDLGRLAIGASVIPALEIRTDDLIATGNNAPAWLRLPGGLRQRRAENRGRGEHLRLRHKLRPLTEKIRSEQLRE